MVEEAATPVKRYPADDVDHRRDGMLY